MSQMERSREQPPPGRTVRLVERRWVATPQPEAFAYAADFSNIENWDPGVVSSSKIGGDPVGVGSRFELSVRFGARTVPMVYEIKVYEPDDRVVLVGTGEQLEAIDEIRFATHDNMTVIDYSADLRFHNIMKHLVPLMMPVLKRVGTRALDGLVAALER
jgi:dehydrogenase/reductase SDR family member 12